MGLFARVVKGAGVDPEDGEILGEYVWDQKSRHKMHGSDPQWQAMTAKGNLKRLGEKSAMEGRGAANRNRRP